MRWTPGNRSENLEDRRGQGVSGIGRLGIGGTVVLLILSVVFGQDFFRLVGADQPGNVRSGAGAVQTTAEEEHMVDFVSFVLDSTQATWARLLPQAGVTYRPAKLVLFRDVVESACGTAESAMGPFYCPADEKVFVDLSFFSELNHRFGAPGDFAQAYVIAHEIGHHVQHLLGIEARVRQARQRGGANANELSVMTELQADCFAGIWGNRSAKQGILEVGDVEEGLGAAAAVGDDRLQRAASGRVVPDAFTHGSSADRVAWFRRGLESGRVQSCDTFSQR
jgi:predicted metalloprotease